MLAVRNIVTLFFALLLSACAIQLVPSYDAALVTGLEKANTETLTLFAAVEDGSPKSEFGKYEKDYAAIIGQFEALRQRALKRDVPPLAKKLAKNETFRKVCAFDPSAAVSPTACLNATPETLKLVLETMREMRKKHKAEDLPADYVTDQKLEYENVFDQVITVETALQR